MTEASMPLPSQPEAGAARTRDQRESIAWAWWQGLQPLRADGSPNPNADSGALARLRRATSPIDILTEEAVFALHHKLGYGRTRADETLVRVAITASVLAHIRRNDPARKPARAAGRSSFADRDLESAALTPLQLRRLLQSREPDDVLRQMRRLVDRVGNSMDVGALAMLILDWFHPENGDRARTRFAYDYYAAAGQPPGAFPTPAE